MPKVLLACTMGFCIVCSVVDCEGESVHIGAGRTCLCVVIYVCASFSVCVSVPSVLFTCGDFKRSIVVLGNGEVQSICAGASVGVNVAVGVCARTGVSLFVP